MGLQIEKILTMSAENWFKLKQESPEDYEFMGVHYFGQFSKSPAHLLSRLVPEDTIVVVDYSVSNILLEKTSDGLELRANVSGTALVLKTRTNPY